MDSTTILLSRENLSALPAGKDIWIPDTNVFSLPETVLQFGTGVLLRALPDFFIDAANKQGLFNGRIVVVKSTDTGDSTPFERQDGLFTVCTRGVEAGNKIEENSINASISRVIAAKTGWKDIMLCAYNRQLKLIISNTTEVGITFVEDLITSSPPQSFPGKLLAFLYERYLAFDANDDSGMVIIPTELLPDNGNRLKSVVLQLAAFNKLEDRFIQWLNNSNQFCSSLVDRIVPGTPPPAEKNALESTLNYRDDLLVIAEAYRLWAIESPAEKFGDILSFRHADAGVVVAPDITKYRELKLRLLNGTHTICCGIGVLSGYETVREAMDDNIFKEFMAELMMENIVPAVTTGEIAEEEAKAFSLKVLDRFQNPHIHHKWLSITLQYSSKMKMRNLPVLLNYFERYKAIPQLLAFGFAAWIVFMRGEQAEDGKYYGQVNGSRYLIQDDKAGYFAEKWKQLGEPGITQAILEDSAFWGQDLTALNGFSEAVSAALRTILEKGALAALQHRSTEKTRIQDEK